MAIGGLNHLTLAVGAVERSVDFYRDTLGCRLRAVWATGAYLEAGALWLCVSKDADARTTPHPDYTHIAFTVAEAEFEETAARIRASGAPIWRENRSEGRSLYFLDPDGHRLEIHDGSLETRLSHYRDHPETGVTILDP